MRDIISRESGKQAHYSKKDGVVSIAWQPVATLDAPTRDGPVTESWNPTAVRKNEMSGQSELDAIVATLHEGMQSRAEEATWT